MQKLQLISILSLAVIMSPLIYAGAYHNALSAAKEADSFLVVTVDELQQPMLRQVPPSSNTRPHTGLEAAKFANMPSGTYIFPVKTDEILDFPFTALRVEEPEHAYSLLMHFKQLQRKEEAAFLIGNCFNRPSQLRIAALKRIQENGFFDSPFDTNIAVFFNQLYEAGELNVIEKRLLLEAFAICNFNRMLEVYVLALTDNKVAKTAGRILNERNREFFAIILKRYIVNENLWKTAILQAEFLVGDSEFVDLAMKWYNMANPKENSPDFIPLLIAKAESNAAYSNIVKNLLVDSKNTRAFNLYRNMSYWLNFYDSVKYSKEIMQFLVNNRNNKYIADSIIYPEMLAAFKKAGHPQSTKMLLRYLEDLKHRNNKPLQEQVCLLFKDENHPNPTVDGLIESLK